MLLFESGPVLLIELAGVLINATGVTDPLPRPTDVDGADVLVGVAGAARCASGALELWRTAENAIRLLPEPLPPPKPTRLLMLGLLKLTGVTDPPPLPTL